MAWNLMDTDEMKQTVQTLSDELPKDDSFGVLLRPSH